MMPKRPRQHVIGDRASHAVQDIIARAEFAVEAVQNDYGDDLLVQTSHAGEIDASRLWFQVKGTEHIARYRRQSGELAYSVPYAHAIKWARSSDPVVVVLWDVPGEIGYFARPVEQVDEWNYLQTHSETTTLLFRPSDHLDVNAVRKLAWLSRLTRYKLLILAAREREHSRHLSESDRRSLSPILALDLLRLLGFVEFQGSPPSAYRVNPIVRKAFVAHFQSSTALGDRERLYDATYSTVLEVVADATDEAPLPLVVVEVLGDALMGALDLKQFISGG
jgi:Domain of unknown function (DUF4365)